ncbi:hypothetical protein T8T21_18395 (plasmid) [Limimaricola variabilis]|jgi:copper transport protein|uniref:hypothetical protein n=1 Tax=Limimaricola variabilis TaxID=1492771 RepID=UPI002AC8F32E|nr:hypothetical protein [Limimaricola variabilis]WPY96471.1 hypothetical protein T8T21_18395 [Limimaricola variabilis]
MDGAPLAAHEIESLLSSDHDEREPIRASAERLGDGKWSAPVLFLPLVGEWGVSLRVRVSDFGQTTLSGSALIDQ